MVKQFLSRQYLRFIPPEKFICLFGDRNIAEAVKICEIVLCEKLKVVSNNNLLWEDTILQVRPNTEKIILGVENGDFGVLSNCFAFLNYPKEIKEFTKGTTLIFNWDDSGLRSIAERIDGEVIFFGLDSKNCHVWAGNIRMSDSDVIFELNFGVERVEIKTKLIGSSQVYPMLMAATLAANLDFSLTTIKKGLEKIGQFPHHLEILKGHNNSIVVDDTLDATPVSVKEAIGTLNLLSARRRILVLGEMRNLGEDSERKHKEIARIIYSNKIDLVFLGGGDASFVSSELKNLGFLDERMESNLQNPQLVSKVLKHVVKGDVVLITGSNGLKFDEVVKKVVKKN